MPFTKITVLVFIVGIFIAMNVRADWRQNLPQVKIEKPQAPKAPDLNNLTVQQLTQPKVDTKAAEAAKVKAQGLAVQAQQVAGAATAAAAPLVQASSAKVQGAAGAAAAKANPAAARLGNLKGVNLQTACKDSKGVEVKKGDPNFQQCLMDQRIPTSATELKDLGNALQFKLGR